MLLFSYLQNLLNFSHFFLFLFQGLMLFCVIMTIFSRNTVHSILYLVLVFCHATALLLLLNLDYIAMVYIVVYVGAIAILFLFVVMMLNIKLLEIKEHFWIYTPIALFIGSILLVELVFIITSNAPKADFHMYYDPLLSPLPKEYAALVKDSWYNCFMAGTIPHTQYTQFGPHYFDWLSAATPYENIHSIGFVLYSFYYFPFIALAFVLFVAMMGSIILTIRDMQASKRQNIFLQIQGDFSSSINLK